MHRQRKARHARAGYRPSNEKKHHHYVPITYLNKFTSDLFVVLIGWQASITGLSGSGTKFQFTADVVFRPLKRSLVPLNGFER